MFQRLRRRKPPTSSGSGEARGSDPAEGVGARSRWPLRPLAIGAAAVACLAVAAGAGAVAVTGGPFGFAGGPPWDRDEPAPGYPSAYPTQCTGDTTVSELLVPSCGAWWGAAPLALTPLTRPEALRAFEKKVGRTLDIMHTYHRGGEVFPTEEEIAMARRPGDNHILYINWKPQLDRTWAEVAAGDPEVDAHIDAVAQRIKKYFGSERFFLTVHHEPENDIKPWPGSGYTAQDYHDMYRYVVERLRDRGVTTAITVMNYMGWPEWCVKDWFPELYPGDDVVDWISFDPYAPDRIETMEKLVNRTLGYESWPGFYDWAAENFPDKPLMVSEWGAFTDSADPRHKAKLFRDIREHIREYPRIKAMIYFSSPDAPKGDTTVDDSEASLGAFRELGNMPYLNPPQPSP